MQLTHSFVAGAAVNAWAEALLLMRHLHKPATAARRADGIVAFAGSG
jgi:hypothetical protein